MKKVVSLLIAVLFTVSLVGCGKDGMSKLSPEEKKYVGRYLMYRRTWEPNGFVDLYADGTGYTKADDNSDNEYYPVRWKYNKEKGYAEVYIPRFKGVGESRADNNGYQVECSSVIFDEEEMSESHYLLSVFTDAKPGDMVPVVKIDEYLISGIVFVKEDSEGVKYPYGYNEYDSEDERKNLDTYKEKWPGYDEFKDGREYKVDTKAVESVEEAAKDYDAYEEKYDN